MARRAFRPTPIAARDARDAARKGLRWYLAHTAGLGALAMAALAALDGDAAQAVQYLLIALAGFGVTATGLPKSPPAAA